MGNCKDVAVETEFGATFPEKHPRNSTAKVFRSLHFRSNLISLFFCDPSRWDQGKRGNVVFLFGILRLSGRLNLFSGKKGDDMTFFQSD